MNSIGQRCCAGEYTLSEAWEEVIPQCVQVIELKQAMLDSCIGGVH